MRPKYVLNNTSQYTISISLTVLAKNGYPNIYNPNCSYPSTMHCAAGALH